MDTANGEGLPAYAERMAWGLLLGLVGSAIAFVFVAVTDRATRLLFPDQSAYQPFSGSWQIVAIMTAIRIWMR